MCKGNTFSRESVTLGLKIADVGENNLGRVGRGHGELGIFLGTDGHGFLKRHGWLRDGKGFICIKAILKYRHGSLP